MNASQGTPDNWIPRSQQLHRLTGKHPMNAEPDMKALYAAGMITPTKLHYVRSHGAVPCLDWNTHILSVDIDHSLRSDTFTMDELAGEGAMGQQSGGTFEVVELPVTIACTGNRRGEVNSVRRSAGFSWGASGVSTCVWRGVFARDVLRSCGLEVGLNHSGRRLYLHFEGAEDLSDGKYATSVPLMHILDPCNDVLFAFGQNGRVLHPDHGFPLRSIIPGFAGGRCIKWLSKVWISDKPSTNHYHIWDNRLLPPQVTDKKTLLARALFHHPDTECNEQALQSVICVPGHGEQILLPKEADNSTYTIRGYAYNGGGTPVNRVEISLDGGATWKYCWREFVDEPLRHGRQCWAWVFWHCDVTYSELVNTKEVIVRAWDAHQTTQPENISWNILGMMNNSWYRVKLGFEPVPGTADLALTARHPVAPGAKEGGWMKAPKEESKNPSGQDVKTFTLEEVAKHDTEKDCWIILEDKVVTSVLSWHPGGAKAITTYAGHATVDATTQYANSKRDECFIGVLSAAGVKAMREDGKRAAKELEAVKEKRAGLAVMPDTFCSAKLKSRKEVSNDTRLYTFELPKTDDGKPGKLGLPIGKHVVIAFHFKDQACTRSYTPVKPVLPHEEDGTFDLLVKTYLPTKTFPPGGTMGNFLDVLQVGQEIDVRGPTGEIEYLSHGKFSIDGNEHYFTKINLIAGGTGLTPHWQLIHAILSTADDTTEISLIDSNKSPADILMHEELEQYAAEREGQFKLWHTIGKDSKPDGWKYDARHLDEDMMREHLFPVAADVGAFMCGPPGLISKAAVPGLKAMGFKEGENMFGF
ncbi:molybdopterin binding oxidoreductase [Exidia glandulosa HHB12029]|uniref:Nitrate reductase [NADPH] n=1 Tax=Exidia glandulosa HHB12029 TaxID=1314781 RepID=A0A165IT69_EXIGL|nr:molybdopterin binding oxidoreductase [Exidia glandulosa HHB12029]